MRWYNRITSVEWLQIAAALTAAPRWAIAIMPLDGVRFRLSSSQWFEVASFVLSLAFAVVEIGATAYMMRAWRREQHPTTRNALGLLWVVSLGLMLVAQVPPLLVNIDGTPISAQPGWLKIAWVTAGVAMTFVIIGGVGFAERTLASDKQPLATDFQPAQPTETDAASTPLVSDMVYSTPQSHQNGHQSDLDRETEQSTIQTEQPAYLHPLRELEGLQSYTLETQPLSGVVASDVRRLLLVAPDATNSAIADRVGCSRETVRKIRLQVGNGHATESN